MDLPPIHEVEKTLASLPTRDLSGQRYWRCLEREFLTSILDPGPSFNNAAARWNQPSAFSALYFCGQSDLARREKEAQVAKSKDLVLASFTVTAPLMAIDLDDPKALASLGITRDDLVMPPLVPRAFAWPRLIASAAVAGGIPAILVPTRITRQGKTASWHNLVAFPALLLRTTFRPEAA